MDEFHRRARMIYYIAARLGVRPSWEKVVKMALRFDLEELRRIDRAIGQRIIK